VARAEPGREKHRGRAWALAPPGSRRRFAAVAPVGDAAASAPRSISRRAIGCASRANHAMRGLSSTGCRRSGCNEASANARVPTAIPRTALAWAQPLRAGTPDRERGSACNRVDTVTAVNVAAPDAFGDAAHSQREIGSLAERIAPTHGRIVTFADAAIAMKPPQRQTSRARARCADALAGRNRCGAGTCVGQFAHCAATARSHDFRRERAASPLR